MIQKIGRLTIPEFQKKFHSGEYSLIDVRTSQELLIFGKISENQIHIDIYKAEAQEQIKKLPREGKFLVYCYHGNRSQHVLNLMQELGFQEVYDLIGGIDVWKKN